MSPVTLRRVIAPLALTAALGGVVTTGSPAVAVRVDKHWPGTVGTPSATSTTPGRLDLRWGGVTHTTRYRLLWSAKPYGGFRDTYGPWLPATARGTSLRVSPTYSPDAGQRTIQTALPYGNPLYVRLQANNARVTKRVATHSSPWSRGYFPSIPTPAAGDTVRVGTYNLGQSTNVSAIVSAIRAQRLHVLSLQEAKGDTAERVARALGWRATPVLDGQQQQVIYDASRYAEGGFRTVAMHNYKGPGDLQAPCVRLAPVTADSNGQAFWVVSAHLVVNARSSQVTRNAQNAADADTLSRALEGFTGTDPVVVAGDFTGNREPYTTATASAPGGAQQALVQRGYWDTRASLKRYGVGYSTYSGKAYPQKASTVGVSSRADYIMTKGIQGSTVYSNVANQRSPLSDHNLVWSELRVPVS